MGKEPIKYTELETPYMFKWSEDDGGIEGDL